MTICFILISIPFLIGGIWVKNYQIDVEGSRVKVRRGIGTTYSFEIQDVQKVIRRINHTRTGTTGKCTIYVKNHKLSVESAMTGFEVMLGYITDNVPAERIITKEITLSKPV